MVASLAALAEHNDIMRSDQESAPLHPVAMKIGNTNPDSHLVLGLVYLSYYLLLCIL